MLLVSAFKHHQGLGEPKVGLTYRGREAAIMYHKVEGGVNQGDGAAQTHCHLSWLGESTFVYVLLVLLD